MNLYNKHRPRKWEDVLGQGIIEILKAQVSTGDVASTYMLSGPSGVGKTTIARIMAMALLCSNRKDGESDPCGECNSCKQIINDTNRDVMEINCATNGGVNEMREMIADRMMIAPVMGDYRVFVMDECLNYDCNVELADGSRLRIGKIVSEKLNVDVLSYNFDTGQMEPKRIIGWHKNSPKPMFCWKFKDKNGKKTFSLKATENHVIFTPEGEKTLKELSLGDQVTAIKRTKCSVRKKAHDYKTIQYIIHPLVEEFLLGTLLGDSSLSRPCAKNGLRKTRLRIMHSIKQQKYFDLKKHIFGDLISNSHLGENKGYGDFILTANTRSVDYLSQYWDLLYSSGRKKITREYLNMLTPLSICAWFLDDGSHSKTKYFSKTKQIDVEQVGSVSLATHGFSEEENNIISDYFKEVWDIDFAIYKDNRGKGFFLVTRGKKNSAKFLDIVSPWMVDGVLDYKLGEHYSCGNGMLTIPRIVMTKEDHSVQNLYTKQDAIFCEKTPVNRHGAWTYDITVEDNHNYIANFVLVHNCHMLTPQAQNALLKIMEEPPSYVKFFLCTTDVHKILNTIKTRCQHYSLKKLSEKDLLYLLKKVVKEEYTKHDEEGLVLISQSAAGSPRSAVSLLNSIASIGVTEENVRMALSRAPRKIAINLLNAILKCDRSEAYQVIMAAHAEGRDLSALLEECVRILIHDVAKSKLLKIKITDEDLQGLIDPKTGLKGPNIIDISSRFLELNSKIRQNVPAELIIPVGVLNVIDKLEKANKTQNG